MRTLQNRIEKLEKQNGNNHEEIYEQLNHTDLDIFERTRILCDAGIISGQMIVKWIKEGAGNGYQSNN